MTAIKSRVPKRTRGGVALVTTGLLLAVTACDGGSGRADDEPPVRTQFARPAAGRPAAAKDLDTDDFNGDGYDDYAGYVVASVKGSDKLYTAHLVIVYGSPKGLRPEWSQHYTGVVGGKLFRADLDGDGYTDLVAGKSEAQFQADQNLPLEPETSADAAGARVWWGGPRGLSAPADLAVPKDTRLLDVADFDGDGTADLLDGGLKATSDPAVADSTDGRMLLGPYDRRGAPARTVALDLGQGGYASPTDATTGDFDGDGRSEAILAYYCAAYEAESMPPCQPMEMRRGEADGSLATDPALKAALNGLKLRNGLEELTADVGDADGDGLDDLIQDDSGTGDAILRVLYGGPGGPGEGRAPATVEPNVGHGFGSPAAVGDMNGDGMPDLLVSAPNHHNYDGLLTLLPGTPDGDLSPLDRATTLDSTTKGLPGTRNPHEWNNFTAAPPLLDVNGDGHDDAVLFLPRYEKEKGMFLVVYGTADGLNPKRTAHFAPADVGVSRTR